MPVTGLRSTQIRDGEVKRPDLNVTEAGLAVVAKVTVAGPGLRITSSGVDAGTGDVVIRMVRTDLIIKDKLKNGGSPDMNIAGAPTEFNYLADGSVDTFLKELVFQIQDDSMNFDKFGNVAALTTGFDLAITQGATTTTLIDKAKTLYQMIRSCQLTFDMIGKYDDSNNEAMLIKIPLNDAKLAAGSGDKIFATVNDNLTGLIRFQGIVVAGRES